MTPSPDVPKLPFASLSDEGDFRQLFGVVYAELRRMAGHYFQNERADHTLQPTALVNELFLRWCRHRPKNCTNPAQFFGAASRAMREILIEHARHTNAQKRGGDWQRLSLEDVDAALPEGPDYRAIDEALRVFEIQDPLAGQIVELRIFGGLSTKEIAELLGMGVSTVGREWTAAKRWLENRLKGHAV
jgi:RNA polymerase sigma factor (TIGR02999 family)